MKIIQVDNYNRDTYDDILICENISASIGINIVDFLNEKYSGEHSSAYFKLVEDDHVLYKYNWD